MKSRWTCPQTTCGHELKPMKGDGSDGDLECPGCGRRYTLGLRKMRTRCPSCGGEMELDDIHGEYRCTCGEIGILTIHFIGQEDWKDNRSIICGLNEGLNSLELLSQKLHMFIENLRRGRNIEAGMELESLSSAFRDQIGRLENMRMKLDPKAPAKRDGGSE